MLCFSFGFEFVGEMIYSLVVWSLELRKMKNCFYLKISYWFFLTLSSQKCLFSEHTGYIEVIMQGKCGRNTETTFDIK